MPESPLSPPAARQTAASSLLSHTHVGAGERAANGDSCSRVSAENWQSLHRKQVSSSSYYSSTSHSSSSSSSSS
ncbi:CRISPR-associated protein Cas7/Csa2 1 [Dissostichus eleginoides]|uniref:CRISPR-associated protein Cas7/Csa2 1 n=1 Tax=Dissostichus eleginoides TaxID=100907 RepID=A0AAD9F3J4_DISEL|nr:CRISPR-associated protein Cas7/Csa2 1 [Dissostichus eleginoides]